MLRDKMLLAQKQVQIRVLICKRESMRVCQKEGELALNAKNITKQVQVRAKKLEATPICGPVCFGARPMCGAKGVPCITDIGLAPKLTNSHIKLALNICGFILVYPPDLSVSTTF